MDDAIVRRSMAKQEGAPWSALDETRYQELGVRFDRLFGLAAGGADPLDAVVRKGARPRSSAGRPGFGWLRRSFDHLKSSTWDS